MPQEGRVWKAWVCLVDPLRSCFKNLLPLLWCLYAPFSEGHCSGQRRALIVLVTLRGTVEMEIPQVEVTHLSPL